MFSCHDISKHRWVIADYWENLRAPLCFRLLQIDCGSGILAATVAAGKPLPPIDWTIFSQMRDEPHRLTFMVYLPASARGAGT